MDVKFTISSHIGSYENTFPIIVKSLIASGVPRDNIYFFIGGYPEYKKVPNVFGVHLYEVGHNSIDLTGLISVIELGLEADFWFLLHDTVEVGVNFYNRLTDVDVTQDTVALTSDGPSMNMGMYSGIFLKNRSADILESKNTDYSQEVMHLRKQVAVETEDIFLNRKKVCFNSSNRLTSGPVDYYGNGVPRIVEYFPDIDLTKVKANWQLKNKYELNL